MIKRAIIFIIFADLLMLSIACNKDFNTELQQNEIPNLPEQSYNYLGIWDQMEEFNLPTQIPTNNGGFIDTEFDIDIFNNSFINQNKVTSNEVATLGRVLFYDTNLSINNSISCASCHKQEAAFADNEALSIGFGGKLTERNSMSLANPVLNNNFFWDSRVNSLEALVRQPIENHIELGFEDMSDLVSKLDGIAYYDELVMKAYGTTKIDEFIINDAIAQFVGSMFSGRSKFDRAKEDNFAEYTELEKHGMALFFSDRTNCSRCHAGPNFAADDSPGGEYGSPTVAGTANVGLDLVYQDQGKGNGKFKIPSLRNIALTGPYMHDGRFNTLEEVIGHYATQIKPHEFLDKNLMDSNSPKKMDFSELEIKALASFLRTLTDEELVSDDKYSNPFRY